MKYRTHITNPTGIKKIEKGNFDISVDFPKVTLNKLDVSSLSLSRDFCISLIAQAGYTEQIIKLGMVGQNKIPHSANLSDIDSGKPLGFRLIIYDPESNKIQASCERIRARRETEEAGEEPLLPVEPAPLGEHLWHLNREQGVEPVLYVNNNPELDLLNIFKGHGDPLYRALVIPEALKQALVHMYHSGSDLEWVKPWNKWVESLGQPSTNEIDVETPDDVEEWAKKCVDIFLQQTSLKGHAIKWKENLDA